MSSIITLNEKKALELMFPMNSKYNGNIHFASKTKNGFRNMGYTNINNVINRLNELKIHPNADYYLTANTTRTGKRCTENIFSYNNIVIDIDCHKRKISPYFLNEALEEFEYRLRRDLYDTDTIPEHNILIRTGRGVQLWWCISQIPSNLGWLYDNAQKYLIKAIKNLIKEYKYHLSLLEVDEASSIKKIGYYRMPATNNTKAKVEVKTEINHEDHYNINELMGYFADEEIEEKKEEVKKTAIFDSSYMTLHKKRIVCIEELARKKSEEGIKEGYRDNYAWLYYNACFQAFGEKQAAEKLAELNANFTCPLKSSEINAIKRYINKKGGLRMKQTTFYELLGDEPAFRTREMERAEKRREKANRNIKIVNLYKTGKTVKEICQEIGVSKPTVLKVLNIKKIKEERKEEIIKLKQKGESIKELADKFKVSIKTIRRNLKNKVKTEYEKFKNRKEQSNIDINKLRKYIESIKLSRKYLYKGWGVPSNKFGNTDNFIPIYYGQKVKKPPSILVIYNYFNSS